MDVQGFKKFCEERKYGEEITKNSITKVKEFDLFLQKINHTIETAKEEAVHKYAQELITLGKNQKEVYYALIRYCYFSDNKDMLIALYELLDGSDVLDNLSRELFEVVGKKKGKEILAGIDFPPLGTVADKKPKITKKVMERLEENLDEKSCHKILLSNLHGIPKESYKRQREKYLEIENVDEYLKERNAEFIKRLVKHRDEKTLFYTQEVDDAVVEHVRNNPQIESGIRKGSIVYAEKIPYLTKRFLKEIDEKMKQYYYCHCSWVREALKAKEVKVPSKFCKCSAGYYKNQWDVILDQSVEVEVVESILDGDSRCLFAIYLPEEIVKKTEGK